MYVFFFAPGVGLFGRERGSEGTRVEMWVEMWVKEGERGEH